MDEYFVLNDESIDFESNSEIVDGDLVIEEVDYPDHEIAVKIENEAEECFKCEDATTVAENDLTTHSLMQNQHADGVTVSYTCLQCNEDYGTIEMFTQMHSVSTHSQSEINVHSDAPQWEILEFDPEINVADHKQIKKEYCESLESETSTQYREMNEAQNMDNQNEIHFATDSDGKKQYYCYECKKIFQDIFTAEQHDCRGTINATLDDTNCSGPIDVDDNLNYFCNICQIQFLRKNDFNDHKSYCYKNHSTDFETAEGNENNSNEIHAFECSICKQLFFRLSELVSHSRIHKAEFIQDNTETPVSTADPTTVNKNLKLPRKATNKKVKKKTQNEPDNTVSEVSCEICNTTFNSKKNLKLHMKIHKKRPTRTIQEALPAGAQSKYDELNQFFCEICNKSFDQNLLIIHKNMHQKIEEYICSVCNRQFENLPSYEIHMQMHADKPKTESKSVQKSSRVQGKITFPCQYCGYVFLRPFEKVKHERIHTGEKPYSCEVCGKTFRVSYSLTLHLRTHTNIRPYVCSICNKRFKSQPVYVHHLRTHNEERDYKCDVCPKSFRTAVQLYAHKNSHTKPYNCTECNRPFSSLNAVKIHMRTHMKSNKSNENLKYRCNICGAVYARNFALSLHLKEQHYLEIDAKQFDVPNKADEDEDGGEGDVDGNIVENDNDESILIAAANSASNGIVFDISGMAAQSILQNSEVIVDNFQTEEIVTDWLTK